MATYRIAADGQSITCLRCRTLSRKRGDIRWRYCGFCKVYHEETIGWMTLASRWLGRLRGRLDPAPKM